MNGTGWEELGHHSLSGPESKAFIEDSGEATSGIGRS